MSASTRIGPFRIARHIRDGVATGKWLVDAPVAMFGKRKRKFFAERSQAERWARELDQKYRKGTWDDVRGRCAPATQNHLSSLVLDAAIEQWCSFQRTRVATYKKKAISLETDLMRLKAALAFFGNAELSSITEEKLASFQAHRLNEQKRKPATIKSDVIALGKVLRWAHQRGHLSRLPLIEHIPEPRREVHVPTLEEVARIIRALPERLRPLVRFLAETGCRSGEAFNLTWDRVNEVTGVVEIRPSERWTPKTQSSQRRFYINGALLAEIRRQPKSGKYVFAGPNPDKPINNIKKAFATAVKTADIRRNGKAIRVTPHTLRKAYATWLALDLKVPQRVLQDLLGHTPGSRVTDQYYVMPLEEAKKKVHVSLPL